MESVRQYILSVAAAAVLCAILRQMLPSKGMAASLFQLVSGIFLAFVVVSPVNHIHIGDVSLYLTKFSSQGDVLAADGENLSRQAAAAIIKDRTEAYILDKAGSYGADLTVEVTLTDDSVPVPESVRITGSLSPYARSVLEAILAEELGIAKEDQTWIGPA